MPTPSAGDFLRFLKHKYVTRSDDRQKQMGLEYVEAEVRDLASELSRFVEGWKP